MSAYFDLFPTSSHSENLYKINRQGKHLITLLCQCRSWPYPKFSTMRVGSRIGIDFVDQKEVCVTAYCFVNCIFIFSPTQHTHTSHHNLGLVMPPCFCNLNIYRAPCQHPQSSTLHLHIDKEANRAEIWNKYSVSSACAHSEQKLAWTFWLVFSQQKCLF